MELAAGSNRSRSRGPQGRVLGLGTKMQPIKVPPQPKPTPPRASNTCERTPPLTPLSRYLMLPDPEEDTTPTSVTSEQNQRLAQRVNLKVVGSLGIGSGIHRKGNTLELSFQKGTLARDSPKAGQSSLSGANRSLNHLVDGKDQRTPQSLERQSQAPSSAEPASTSLLSGQRKISFGSGPVPQCALERRLQQISAPPLSPTAEAAPGAAAAAASPSSSASVAPVPPASPAATVPTTRESRSRPSVSSQPDSPAAAGTPGSRAAASPAAPATAQPGTTIVTGKARSIPHLGG